MDSMYYIGLDIHKKTISYCVKEQNGIVCSEGTIPATRLTLDHWTDTLPQPWTAAMEATMFTGWVYDHLLPRRPRARANDSSSFIGAEIIWFQSTPPREGERLIVGTGVVVLLFQSTPPARGRTAVHAASLVSNVFQSTPPREGEHQVFRFQCEHRSFNPRPRARANYRVARA